MNKKVLVLGEICMDRFVYGECKRLNPEAPTPVFVPKYEESNLGMAGNTLNNLKHLGLEVDSPVECNQAVIGKTRYVDEASNYILLRIDSGEELIKPITMDIINSITLEDYDAVVISDYDKGLLDERSLTKIFRKCDDLDIPTFMDTKKQITGYSNCTFIKINESEYNANTAAVLNKFHKDSLIVTLGDRGCRYNDKIYTTEKVEVRDVVGAGDTFLAGLVYGYLKNNDIEEGIVIANRLASDVVTKRGVALPNKNLIKILKER